MDLFDLVAKIKLDSSEYESGIKEAKGKIAGFASGVKNGLGTIAKVSAAVIAAGAAAAATLVKQSVDAYAEYEQLAGGVEKLFGAEASQKVLEYAQNAYKTAGMSANQYLDQATSFAAALIQSYEGDTEKAADMADVAMRAISDNFNTFGGDIQSIQSAFQGFAKGNYTMLDNLKLGYGGTKTEMERLIADANEYAKSIGKASDLSLDSFGDIVEAIQLIQEKQGIAGTTEAEALKTISGSLMMTKAAWANLMTSLGDSNADLGKAFDILADSATAFLDNVLPVAENAIAGIGTVIQKAGPLLAKKLPQIITKSLPGLVKAGTGVVTSLLTGIVGAIPDLVRSIPEIVSSIIDGFKEAWPELKAAGKEVIKTVGNGIKSGWNFVWGAFSNRFPELSKSLSKSWGKVSKIATDAWKGVSKALPKIWDGIKKAGSKAGEGISKFWSRHGEKIKGVFTSAWDFIKAKAEFFGKGLQAVFGALGSFWNEWGGTITGFFSGMWEAIQIAFDTALTVISDLFSIFADAFNGDWQSAWEKTKQLGSDLWNGIKDTLMQRWETIKSTASEIFTKIKDKVSEKWEEVKTEAPKKWEEIKSKISQKLSSIKSAISQKWDEIKSTITTKLTTILSNVTSKFESIRSTIQAKIDAAKSAVSTAVENIKSFFTGMNLKIPDIQFPTWDSIKGTVEDLWSKIVGVLGQVIKLEFKLPKLRVTDPGQLPWGILGKGRLPQLDVIWEKKALDNPLMFGNATLFGAGEAGDEILYGRERLMGDIKHAVSGSTGTTNNISITVNAAPGMDENALADKVARRLQQQLNRRQAVWA